MALGTPANVYGAEQASAAAHTSSSVTVTSGERIYAIWGCWKGAAGAIDAPTISDSQGLTWSSVGSQSYNPGGTHVRLHVWRATSNGNAMTVTVTPGANAWTRGGLQLVSISGASTDITNTGVNTNASGDPAPSLGSAPAASSTVLGVFYGAGTNDPTAPTNYTEINEFPTNSASGAIRLQSVYDAGSAAQSATWTTSNNNSIGFLVEVKESAGAYVLTADAGIFTLTGSAATLKAGRKISAAQGTFALTGANATLRAARKLPAGALPDFVGIGASATGTGDVLVPAPAGIRSGDFLVIGVQSADEAVSTPSGWSEHPLSPVSGSTSASRVTVFYKVADGTETGVTVTDPGDHLLAAMFAVRHVDTTDPFLDSDSNDTSTLPDITPGYRGNLIAAIMSSAGVSAFSSSSGWAATGAASETERLNATTTSGADGALIIWTAVFYPNPASSTTTGPFSGIGGGPDKAGIHFAFRPKHLPGEFTLTGSAASLKLARKIAAAAGSFALTGSAATLRAARKITAEEGTFTLTGAEAALRKGYSMAADAGAFVLTGAAAAFRRTYVMPAAAGEFILTGATAALRIARKLIALAGEYILTGYEVEFDKLGLDLTDVPTTVRIITVPGEDRTIIVPAERPRVIYVARDPARELTVDRMQTRTIVIEPAPRTIFVPPEDRTIRA